MSPERSPQIDPRNNLQNVDNRELAFPVAETRRPVNQGAERWLGEKIPVLDQGFVYLVDYMGTDESIEQAARVSYGAGTRSVSQTEGLIRYLYRNRHTTPFEMVELKFHAKMPIFVARQWVRHRTANINEYSARYSILENEFYLPESQAIALQSQDNKQGRDEVLATDQADAIRNLLRADMQQSYALYEQLTQEGLARELARINLPTAIYTQWYWKIDLHNLLHFLDLRMDPHAQYEIRAYAQAMAQIVEESYPLTWKAFVDYRRDSISLSGPEQQLIKVINDFGGRVNLEQLGTIMNGMGMTNKRERSETENKLGRLGLLSPNE